MAHGSILLKELSKNYKQELQMIPRYYIFMIIVTEYLNFDLKLESTIFLCLTKKEPLQYCGKCFLINVKRHFRYQEIQIVRIFLFLAPYFKILRGN